MEPALSGGPRQISARHYGGGADGLIALYDSGRLKQERFRDGLEDRCTQRSVGYRSADGRWFRFSDGVGRQAGRASRHLARRPDLVDDPGVLCADDLRDRVHLQYHFDHHYDPDPSRPGAEHVGKSIVVNRAVDAVGLVRLYDAGGHPAQRHRLFERLDRYTADGSGGNRAECAGNFIGDGDVLRRALFHFGDRSGGFPRLGGESSLWSLSACSAFD